MSKKNKVRSAIMILASSTDNTIGESNDIPWSCKTDMKFFKRATSGHVVIMGRKTYESMGCKPLPNRVNIVVSTTMSKHDAESEGIILVNSIMSAVQHARKVDLTHLKRNTIAEHIFIIGGVALYKSLIGVTSEVLHSKIDVMCGGARYGMRFITGDLSVHFTDNPSCTTEVIYYNDNAVATKDKDKLIEITHSYRNNADEIFNFIED